jgi:diacylglycerol kinase
MIKFSRLIKSFTYAIKGLIRTFQEEQNLKIQSFFGIAVLFLGWLFEIAATEWIFLILAIGLVLLAELINSAVERISDVLKPRINSYVKEIKDIMAAAVLLSSLIAVLVGLIIFIPYFKDFLFL